MKNVLLGCACLSIMSLSSGFSCKTNGGLEPTTENATADTQPKLKSNIIVNDKDVIWGMDFLPNGDLLFTEKQGKFYRYSGGKTTELSGAPTDVFVKGQGGLLDLRVHPKYAQNGWIYATYVSKGTDDGSQLNLIRFKLNGDAITGTETIFTTPATNTMYNHYGSRIEFDNKGFLFLSIGEGGATSYGGAESPNMNAQNVTIPWGKVHRMTDDGKVPSDNPVLEGNSAPSTVYSYGHRNPQGLAFNPTTQEIWESEHGPRGGDEVNVIQKGKNYGWPVVSYGINYDGKTISKAPAKEGVTLPQHQYTPSIGTCGISFITSDKYKGWKGSLLVGGLAYQYLSRLEIKDGKVVKEQKLLESIGRVRNVKQGPDGLIYISVEGPGRIIQLLPE